MLSKKSSFVRMAIVRLIKQNKFFKLTPENILKINRIQSKQQNSYIFGKKIFDARDILLTIFEISDAINKKKKFIKKIGRKKAAIKKEHNKKILAKY
jgi:hypothetical protein